MGVVQIDLDVPKHHHRVKHSLLLPSDNVQRRFGHSDRSNSRENYPDLSHDCFEEILRCQKSKKNYHQ